MYKVVEGPNKSTYLESDEIKSMTLFILISLKTSQVKAS